MFRVSKGFDQTDSALIPAGSSGTVIMRHKVPHSTSLRITHFGNDIEQAGGWGSITWKVLIDGRPDETLGKVKDQLGYTSQMRELGRKPIVHGGSVLEVYAENSDGVNAYDALVSFKGEYGREY